MSSRILSQYHEKFLKTTPQQLLRDIFGGVIVALVSIPISMGYAQIAGLPMQYGLYGSVFPILLFGLLTSSRDFVFGVDAAPAALVGGALIALGIEPGSQQAITAVPTLAFFTACWLALFFLLKAGRIAKYISSPVMGGFVTGICCTIILMQIPKLFGGSAGVGEAPELIVHIAEQCQLFEPVSFLLGAATITLIMLGKKFAPGLPVSVIVMVLGAVLTRITDVEAMGVKLLPKVEAGFPGFSMLGSVQSFSALTDYLFSSLSVAAVILAESLLASKGNAVKDGYRLDENREILSYCAANLAGALCGCCPTNGSVSRTGIVRQFGAKSQWLSVSAAASMLLILCFGTFFIEYLPVPVLTAIVISALFNACEFHEAARLRKVSRGEFRIFMAALFGVLIFGTVYGVMIGIVLSFMSVIRRAVTPPRSFMGVIPGREGFFSLDRSSDAHAVQGVIIYRFGGNLFFANTDTFVSDIEKAIKPDTKVVVVNAGGIASIDITACDRLILLYHSLMDRGIRLYITEHAGELNDMLRKSGAQELLVSGAVRMTIPLALRDAGIPYPYRTESEPGSEQPSADIEAETTGKRRAGTKRRHRKTLRPAQITRAARGIQAELEWALGEDAERFKDEIAHELLSGLENHDPSEAELVELERHTIWGRINFFDEDELLGRMEKMLDEAENSDPGQITRLRSLLQQRRSHIEQQMLKMDSSVFERLSAAIAEKKQ